MAGDGVSRVFCTYPDGRRVEAQTTDWALAGALARAVLRSQLERTEVAS